MGKLMRLAKKSDKNLRKAAKAAGKAMKRSAHDAERKMAIKKQVTKLRAKAKRLLRGK